VLEQLLRRHSSSQQTVLRIRILLAADEGFNQDQTARRLGVQLKTVKRWRHRWAEVSPALEAARTEGIAGLELIRMIEGLLSDRPRPGGPTKFSAEQIVQVVKVACETPQACGRPVSHWTSRELQDEVVKRGIVESISTRSVERFLKGGRPQAASEPVLAAFAGEGKPGV
jgi:putative transposase